MSLFKIFINISHNIHIQKLICQFSPYGLQLDRDADCFYRSESHAAGRSSWSLLTNIPSADPGGDLSLIWQLSWQPLYPPQLPLNSLLAPTKQKKH